jgi:ABC-type glycerol-3-phosphate transport system substrate-binding protein
MKGLKSLSPFQIALAGIFGFLALFAMMSFSLGWFAGDKSTTDGLEGTVTVWGTLPKDQFDTLVKAAFPDQEKLTVTYVEKTPDEIDRQLGEAVAIGSGPDMILIPQDRFLRQELKVQPLSIDLRSFQDTFVPQGEMYVTPSGVYALPIAVDPLVMYWNRGIFSTAGLAKPPQYWEEFFSLVPTLTKFSDPLTKSISQSAVSLGEYTNIPDAKEILSALLLQAGDRIIGRDPSTGAVTVYFGEKPEGVNESESPLASVLRFYLQFANQNNAAYTWNRSLQNAQDMFVSGKLAMYFGLASEAPEIVRRNPHLDFDVAMLPQLKDANAVTFGRMYGLSILKGKGTPLVLAVATQLSYSPVLSLYAVASSFAPAQRDLVASPPPTDARANIFFKSALISAGWFDPDPALTTSLFTQLINDAGSDNRRIFDAMASAEQRLTQVFRATQPQ